MLCDESFVMPSTLVSCSSCSMTISCSTSCGLAPGQRGLDRDRRDLHLGRELHRHPHQRNHAEQRDQQHADGDFHRDCERKFR